jgi:hypothetical protein
MRTVLLHGKVSDIEVALRCAATTFGALDITHRVPFDEVARRASTGSLLSMMPSTAAEHIQYEEYSKYFRSKERAGVAKLDAELSLFVIPPTDDVAVLRDSVYALNPGITPRSNCLLGLIAPSTDQMKGEGQGPARPPPVRAPPVAPVPEAPVAAAADANTSPAKAVKEEAAPTVTPAEAEPAKDAAAAPGKSEGTEDAGEETVSQKEILDLFSNPELLKLLSDDGGAADK